MSSLARRACYKCGTVGHFAAKQCYHCQGMGHVQADCPTRFCPSGVGPPGIGRGIVPARVGFVTPFPSFMASPRMSTCYKCGGPNHYARDCQAQTMKCYACGKLGHISRDCTAPHGGPLMTAGKKCYRCGDLGHISRDCPHLEPIVDGIGAAPMLAGSAEPVMPNGASVGAPASGRQSAGNPARARKGQGIGKAGTNLSQARKPADAAARDGGAKTAGAFVASLAKDHAIPGAGLTVAYGRAGTTLRADLPPAVVPNAGVVVGRYVALDCEMVGPVNERSIVARVSVVDYHGEQVYDSYVRPTEHVTDWRTWVSGVSAPHMPTGVEPPSPGVVGPSATLIFVYVHPAHDFTVLQRDIIELLQGRVLDGHDLQQDLNVLHLTHPRRDIRDTQRHPPFRALAAGKTPGLK
ncbi:MAG: hypothetical protein M1826_007116 [Phylliscum demangeonii]|nr:MAG: hypothetical protein M1826_007116 [Phylliscum demangeonii]